MCLTLAAAAAVASWRAAPPVAAGPAPDRPLTISVEQDPSSLDTILNTPYGWLLAPLTQGYLFLVDEHGSLVPDCATAVPTRENGGISADGRTIVYRIRTGRWSDGAPFDAADVVFTVAALRNPATNVPDRSTVDQIERIEAPLPDRLVVRLRRPSAPFVSSFLTLGADDPFAILPRHVVAGLRDLNASSLDTHPVGLGPFRLASWRRGERLEFVRNPFYWRGPAGLDRLVVVPDPDPETRFLQARTGDLDLTYLSGLEVDEAERSGVRVIRATTNIVDFLQFNIRRLPALRDAGVRRALVAALDRSRIAATIFRGLEQPTDTGMLEPGLADAASLPRYDPAAARARLAGRVPPLDFAYAGKWRSSAAAALEIAAELGAAGVATTLRSYPTNTFWGPKSAGGVLESGHFDLALTSWSPSLDPDRSYLFGCAALPPAGGNAGGYCDPAYDAAEARGAARYDPAGRLAAYRAAAQILARDAPVAPIGFERSAYAISARFRNFEPGVLGRDYWNAWAWQNAASAATNR